MKHAALIGSALLLVATTPRCEVFKEDFSEGLDPKRWIISAWVAPHNSAHNKTEFKPDHVKVVDGILQLKLTQMKLADGTFISFGGELKTIAKFGYGTYEFELKASSTGLEPEGHTGKSVSGSITGAASFLLHSETEIDIEYEGLPERAHLTQSSTWVDENKPSQITKTPIENIYAYWPHQRFHAYRYVWSPGKVVFFRDNVVIATHTRIVPEAPAPFLFNHWGTNSKDWGGLATPNVIRYMYIKNFSFTPLKGTQ